MDIPVTPRNDTFEEEQMSRAFFPWMLFKVKLPSGRVDVFVSDASSREVNTAINNIIEDTVDTPLTDDTFLERLYMDIEEHHQRYAHELYIREFEVPIHSNVE